MWEVKSSLGDTIGGKQAEIGCPRTRPSRRECRLLLRLQRARETLHAALKPPPATEARLAPSSFSVFRTRITACYPYRVETLFFVSYQDDHTLLLALADLGGRRRSTRLCGAVRGGARPGPLL